MATFWFLQYLWGIETSYGILSSFVLLSSFYSTYEELKQSFTYSQVNPAPSFYSTYEELKRYQPPTLIFIF